MKIGIDIDGVVCRYEFSALTKEAWGVPIPNSQIWTYYIEEALGVPTEEVEDLFFRAAPRDPHFAPYVLEVLARIQKAGHQVLLYTARDHFMGKAGARKWIKKHGIPCSMVYFKGQEDKVPYLDYLIDDSVRVLVNLSYKAKHLLLYDRPWNRSCLNISKLLRRVRNWKEIEGVILYAQDS